MTKSCTPKLDQDEAIKKAESCLKHRRKKFIISNIRAKTVNFNKNSCEWKVVLFSPDAKFLFGNSKTYTLLVDDKTGKCTDFNSGPVTVRKKS